MCPDAAEEPSVISARAGLFWLRRTETVKDEKADGEYGLVINGHSLVRRLFHALFPAIVINRKMFVPVVSR